METSAFEKIDIPYHTTNGPAVQKFLGPSLKVIINASVQWRRNLILISQVFNPLGLINDYILGSVSYLLCKSMFQLIFLSSIQKPLLRLLMMTTCGRASQTRCVAVHLRGLPVSLTASLDS